MNKKLRKEIKLYIKSISKLSKSTFTLKKVVLKDLKNNIYNLYLDNPNLSITDIYERFGSTDDISKSFENLSTEILIRKANKYKLLWLISSIVIILLLIFTIIIVLSNLSNVSIIN